MSREERMVERRERKFDKHAIRIEPESITEQRKDQEVNFKFAVYSGKRVIARATKMRYALKAAHNHISRQGGRR